MDSSTVCTAGITVCHVRPCTWPLSMPCLKFGLHAIRPQWAPMAITARCFGSPSVQAYLVYIRTAQCWKLLEVMSGRHCPCSASKARHCRLGSRCPADTEHKAGWGWWYQGWNQSQVGSLSKYMNMASKVVGAHRAEIHCYCCQGLRQGSILPRANMAFTLCQLGAYGMGDVQPQACSQAETSQEHIVSNHQQQETWPAMWLWHTTTDHSQATYCPCMVCFVPVYCRCPLAWYTASLYIG